MKRGSGYTYKQGPRKNGLEKEQEKTIPETLTLVRFVFRETCRDIKNSLSHSLWFGFTTLRARDGKGGRRPRQYYLRLRGQPYAQASTFVTGQRVTGDPFVICRRGDSTLYSCITRLTLIRPEDHRCLVLLK